MKPPIYNRIKSAVPALIALACMILSEPPDPQPSGPAAVPPKPKDAPPSPEMVATYCDRYGHEVMIKSAPGETRERFLYQVIGNSGPACAVKINGVEGHVTLRPAFLTADEWAKEIDAGPFMIAQAPQPGPYSA